MGEAQVLGSLPLTPNCSLRAGLDFMVIDSLALAPRQINFINDFSKIETGGNPVLHGRLARLRVLLVDGARPLTPPRCGPVTRLGLCISPAHGVDGRLGWR